jgi:hypothetical protein
MTGLTYSELVYNDIFHDISFENISDDEVDNDGISVDSTVDSEIIDYNIDGVIVITLLATDDNIIAIFLVVTPVFTIVSSRVIHFILYANEPFEPHYFSVNGFADHSQHHAVAFAHRHHP